MMKSDELLKRLKEIGGHGFNIVNNGKFIVIFVSLKHDGEYAIHITLPHSSTDEEVNEIVSNPSRYVDMIVGVRVNHTISAVSSYNMHCLLTTKFQVGRCFFAGDSAHQWVPAGGLGLNTGIGDVFNLTWKMAAVLRGYAGPQMLSSYEVERKPVCDLNRRYAMFFGRVGGIGSKPSPLRTFVLSNRTLVFLLRNLLAPAFAPQIIGGQVLVYGLEYINSDIILHEHNPHSYQHLNTSLVKFVPSSYPGLRAPHVVVPDKPTILDHFGKSFVLLVVGGRNSDCRGLQQELEKRNVPLTVYAYPKQAELPVLYDRKYFLIRPDGVICWRSDFQPSSNEAQRIVSLVLGDCPLQRLPPFQPTKPPSQSASLVLDVVLGGGIGTLFYKFGGLSFKAAVGVGLGLFWCLRHTRALAVPQPMEETTGRHKAALVKGFGNAEQAFEVDPRYTQRFGPNDILIRVHATSVDAHDVNVRRGYTATKQASEFPILLGRDCSGEVVAVGDNVFLVMKCMHSVDVWEGHMPSLLLCPRN